jgi:DNA-binding MarR family transcriptional regulator
MQSSDPQWLTSNEQDAWLSLVGVLFRLPGVIDTQLQRDAGLNHFEYLVIAVLAEAPNHTLRMSDLAIMVNGSLSRLSHVVQRLEKRHWVRRAPSPSDGRYTEAKLTDDGYAKAIASAPGYVRAVRDLVIDALSAEQHDQLNKISSEILNRLDQAAS